jgi:Domain of unknown function (DUF4893)
MEAGPRNDSLLNFDLDCAARCADKGNMVAHKIASIFTALLVAGCGGGERPDSVSRTAVEADWHKTVTSADMNRLRDWRTAFTKAIDKASASGNAESIAREGVLLQPDAALDSAPLFAGSYRCRVIKIGGKAKGAQDYVVYPPTPCAVTQEEELLGFAKSGGTQRPVGLFFPGDSKRMIFLGTMVLGDERRPLEYGRDSMRDMAGALERVGERRWRIILPYPRFESMLDVIEIVPAT